MLVEPFSLLPKLGDIHTLFNMKVFGNPVAPLLSYSDSYTRLIQQLIPLTFIATFNLIIS